MTVEKSTRLKVDMTGTGPQSTLYEIVNIAMEKIKERKVFNASIRNEMTVFRFELEEGSQEFSVLKTTYESLLKKGDAEKFYSNFYGDIAANATRYFKGLTRNAATLLATKVADSMILFWKQEKQTTTNSIAAELNDKQRAGLQYIGGYVFQNLFKKHCRVNSDESQQAMAILKAGKVESGASQKLVSSLNRGGLWSVTLPAEKIFLKTENYFRQSTVNEAFHKIDIGSITRKSSMDSDVLANYDLIMSEAECKPDIHVRKDVLHDILSLYVRVRSFSYSKDIVQLYRIKAKQNKSKSLRKEISRSCQENEQPRQV